MPDKSKLDSQSVRQCHCDLINNVHVYIVNQLLKRDILSVGMSDGAHGVFSISSIHQHIICCLRIVEDLVCLAEQQLPLLAALLFICYLVQYLLVVD